MSRRAGLGCLLAALSLVLNLAARPAGAEDKKAYEIVKEARQVVEEVMDSEDNSIPLDLLRRCAGVIIFPWVVKGGFIVGGSYGRGVVMSRSKDNVWRGPAFIEFGGGSLGFQIGIQSIELILVIMNQRGMEAIMSSKVKLGADLAVAAGPVGRRGEASTDITLKAEVYSYSRTKGLFAGISLEGSGIGNMEELNQEYYKQEYSARDILFRGKASPPKSGRDLIATLARYAGQGQKPVKTGSGPTSTL